MDMPESEQTIDVAFVVGRSQPGAPTEYLRIVKLPWWCGRGNSHTFTPKSVEATLLSHRNASDSCAMHNDFSYERNVSESKVLTLQVSV